MLRRTAAKVASLHQAADLRSFPLSELINTLREKVGYELFLEDYPEVTINTNKPKWYDPYLIAGTIDASSLIESEENPTLYPKVRKIPLQLIAIPLHASYPDLRLSVFMNILIPL